MIFKQEITSENFFNKQSDFFSSVFRFTMRFKSKDYENEYLKSKFERKNIFVVIGISVLFNAIMIGIRLCIPFLKLQDDIGKNPSEKVYKNTLTLLLLWNAGIALEIVIFFITKLRILRGFFICSVPFISVCFYSSFLSNEILEISRPVFINTVFYSQSICIISAFIYSSNWICGSCQIIIYNLILSIFYILMPGNATLDKPFYIVLNGINSLNLILVIYCFEFLHRTIIFTKLEAEKGKNILKQILDNLPNPIVITENQVITYKNKAYEGISSQYLKSEGERNKKESNPNENESQLEFTNINLDHRGSILNDLYSKKSNTNLLRVLAKGEELQKELFEIEQESETQYSIEVSSLSLEMDPQKSILYMMNNLTSFSKVKDLESRETFQRIYFASITHDFRTPISIISGNCEILFEYIKDDNLRKLVTNIKQGSSILEMLVQDILDYSQIKSGTLSLAPHKFNPFEEFPQIIDLFEEKYREKGLFLKIHIDSDVPIIINNDAKRIKQILVNLISNSLKFTQRGGVELNVEYLPNEQSISFSVIDTGVGMSPDELLQLFQEYTKINRHRSLNPNGVGLGLHICKQLVIKMGGKISVQSQLEIGSTFTFQVLARMIEIINELQPTAMKNMSNNTNKNGHELLSSNRVIIEEEKEAKVQCMNLPFEYHKTLSVIKMKKFCNCSKVLIVDDDLGIRSILVHYAKAFHLDCDEAFNGLIAIEKVKKKLEDLCCKFYELIFIDYHMPEMNGVKASLIIKDILDLCSDNHTKIILVSGLTNEEQRNISSLPKNPFALIESKPLTRIKFTEVLRRFIL